MKHLRLIISLAIAFAGLAVALGWRESAVLGQEIAVWTLLVTGPFFIGFATEPERLPSGEGRRWGSTRWLNVLLLPGGGRGLILLFGSLSWLLGSAWLGRVLQDGTMSPYGDEDLTQLAIVCLYAWIYVALPSTIFAAPERSTKKTWLLRSGLVSVVLSSWFLPILGRPMYALVPMWMVEQVKRDGGITEKAVPDAFGLVVVFGAALILATPRMIRAAREAVFENQSQTESGIEGKP